MADQLGISLSIDGISHLGWGSVFIYRSLQSASGYFDLSLAPNWENMPEGWKAKPGAACEVLIGDTPVVTGFVDAVTSSLSAETQVIRVSGRDKTADLVDCHYEKRVKSWQQTNLREIASNLVQKFHIRTDFKDDPGKAFPLFVIEEGETIFNTLNRAARLRGLLISTDGRGALIFFRPKAGTPQFVLEEGQNILNLEYTLDHSNRFSIYQMLIPTFVLEKSFGVIAHAEDSAIRYRPLLMPQDGYVASDEKDSAKTRMNFELSQRKAKSERAIVTVPGWSDNNGRLFELGQSVQVKSKRFALKKTFIITSVSFSLDQSSGRTTELQCEPASAYQVDPTLENRQISLMQIIGGAN